MRKRPLVLIALATFVGLHFEAGKPSLAVTDEKFLIVPGVRVGMITPTSTEAELKKAYPQGSVSSLAVYTGEGETELGTVLFANDPKMRLEVLWKDKQNRRNPTRVQISGSKSLWKTSEGITLGSALTDLERMNGKPFTLTGFAWDYSGTVTSWRDGKLEQALNQNGRLILRLEPDKWDSLSEEERDSVTGDGEHSSSEPIMQKLNPKIYQIIVEFK